jgi:hypothetical protein
MWYTGQRLHRRDEPAYLRCPSRCRSRGRVRTLFQGDRNRGPVQFGLYRPVQEHRCEDHGSVSRRGKPVMVRPDYYGAAQHVRLFGTVRAHPSFPCISRRAQTKFSYSFDLCRDTGTGAAFFTGGRGAFTGTYQQVSCDEWDGEDGSKQWADACLSGETADNWPAIGCGNLGTAFSLPTPRNVLIHAYFRQRTLNKWCEQTKTSTRQTSKAVGVAGIHSIYPDPQSSTN